MRWRSEFRRSSGIFLSARIALLSYCPAGKPEYDKRCDNFEELTLVTNKGNIDLFRIQISKVMC